MNDFNAVIHHPNRCEFDDELDRRIVFESDDIVYFPVGSTIFDVLVKAGFFPSKNEARRNWDRGELKDGFNRFERVGKLKRNLYVLKLPDNLSIWNPSA